jgi:hypothetical protein
MDNERGVKVGWLTVMNEDMKSRGSDRGQMRAMTMHRLVSGRKEADIRNNQEGRDGWRCEQTGSWERSKAGQASIGSR